MQVNKNSDLSILRAEIETWAAGIENTETNQPNGGLRYAMVFRLKKPSVRVDSVYINARPATFKYKINSNDKTLIVYALPVSNEIKLQDTARIYYHKKKDVKSLEITPFMQGETPLSE